MNPSIPEQIARNRRYIRARSKPRIGKLGKADGTLYHPDSGYYWARWRGSKDANGNASDGQPFAVWAGETNFLPQAHRQVYIGRGLNGRLTVLGAVPTDLINAGFDARAHNPNDAYRQYVYTPNIVTFRSDALADEGNDSLKVNLNQLLYKDAYGDYALWNGTDETTHLDLAAFEALLTVDQHCLAIVALKTLENETQTAASTPKSLFDPLTMADAQEAAGKLDPECIDSRVYRIYYDQQTLIASPVTDWDLRQWINVPARLGNPTVITERLRVRANHQMLYYGEVQILGELQVLGEVLLLGTGGGSSGMTSFDVAADTGTPATIVDGDELGIVGDGLTIETSIAAKVVTIGLTQDAIVKLCDLRMTHDIELPYYADITDENELLCAPIKSGMVTLPVAGLWRYFEVAGITTPIEAANTETGNTTSGSAVITNMSFTRSLAPGMPVSGTGINAAATISTVDSATQITMTHTATATNTGVTLTFEFPADTTYDVFLVYDSGLATVVPFYRKWQSASSRSLMTQVNGIWLSNADTDARWIGAVRVPTNQLFQKSPLQCFISNLDHPFSHPMRVTDTTDSWSYNGGWRQARATAANKVEFIACLWNFTYSFRLLHYSGGAGVIGYGGIGLNSTSAPASESIGRQGSSSASQIAAPVLLEGAAGAGYNAVNWLEKSTVGAVTFYGDNAQTDGMQSGLTGSIMA